MIWSVSTSTRSTIATLRGEAAERLHASARGSTKWPATAVAAATAGLTQVRPPARALAALEVAVRGRGAALARLEDVRVHAQAHRAAGAAPLEAGSSKTRSSPSSSAWRFTCAEPGTTIACTDGWTCRPRRRAAAARRSSIRAFVHEPMKTRSTWMSSMRVPGLERHVGERALDGRALVRVVERRRVGHGAADRRDHLRVRAPGDLRRERRDVDGQLAVEARVRRRVGSARQASSARSQSPVGAPGRPSR